MDPNCHARTRLHVWSRIVTDSASPGFGSATSPAHSAEDTRTVSGATIPSAAEARTSSGGSPYTGYSVSWNLTRRCNLECSHCYMSAFAGADTRGELSTPECRRVMDEIALVNPNVFLILTGGEPLLRKDIWDIAAYAA